MLAYFHRYVYLITLIFGGMIFGGEYMFLCSVLYNMNFKIVYKEKIWKKYSWLSVLSEKIRLTKLSQVKLRRLLRAKQHINFTVLETGHNTDQISEPWYDCHLIAKKPEKGSKEDLEYKMDKLEDKLDLIMSKLNI